MAKLVAILLGTLVVCCLIWSVATVETSSSSESVSPERSGFAMASPTPADALNITAVFQRFEEGITRARLSGDLEVSNELLELAERRHTLMSKLIEDDPEEALQWAVSFSEYHLLPDRIKRWVEEPFSSPVELDVLPICNAPDGIHRELVEIGFAAGGIRWQVRRTDSYASMQSRNVVLVQGIRLNGRVALHDGAATSVRAADREWVEGALAPGHSDLRHSFLTGKPVGENPVVALMGGKRIVLANEAEVEELNRRAAWLDALPGPDGGSGLLLAMPFPADGGGIDWAAIESTAINLASNWTETPKEVFVIRVDFPDHTAVDHPLPSAATLEQVFDLNADTHFRAMSYGKTGIDATVGAGVTRMPNPTTTGLDVFSRMMPIFSLRLVATSFCSPVTPSRLT